MISGCMTAAIRHHGLIAAGAPADEVMKISGHTQDVHLGQILQSESHSLKAPRDVERIQCSSSVPASMETVSIASDEIHKVRVYFVNVSPSVRGRLIHK